MSAYKEKTTPAICACGCDKPFMAIIREIARGRGKYMNHSHSARKQNLDGRGWPGRKGRPKPPKPLNPFLSPGGKSRGE